MSSRHPSDTAVLGAIAVASALVLLYGLVIVQQPLLAVLVVLPLLVLYLLWRLVRAVETIATSMDRAPRRWNESAPPPVGPFHGGHRESVPCRPSAGRVRTCCLIAVAAP